MAIDPTSLEAAEATLAEARRRTAALAVFSRRLSHDLSNFLTVIRTYSELLLADVSPDDPSRADLGEIGQAADETVAYLQRASAFGRALHAPVGPLAIDGLVTAATAQLLASGRGPIECEATSGARAQAAAGVLAEALHELVTNAREAAGAAATLRVRTRHVVQDAPAIDGGVPIPAGAWGVIEVRDPGPGFAATLEPDACDPFVTSKAGVRGAGLGLAIARAAAWGAGGQLTLGRDGDETVARLYLPLVRD